MPTGDESAEGRAKSRVTFTNPETLRLVLVGYITSELRNLADVFGADDELVGEVLQEVSDQWYAE